MGPHSALQSVRTPSDEIASIPRVWWVNQGWSFAAEVAAGVVFAGTDHGRVIPHHQVLVEMRPGDVTVHYSGKAIRAIGVVQTHAVRCRRPYPAEKRNMGLAVRVEYFELDVPIPINELRPTSDLNKETNMPERSDTRSSIPPARMLGSRPTSGR